MTFGHSASMARRVIRLCSRSVVCLISPAASPNRRACPELDLICPPDFFDVIGDDLFRTIPDSHHTEDACDSDEDAENG